MNFTLTDRINATGGFWPIPNSELLLFNGIMEQNPGWNGSDGSL